MNTLSQQEISSQELANQQLASIVEEYSGADFESQRLSSRLKIIAEHVAKQPDKSFPVQMNTDSALESVYRFLGNEKVSFERILQPHIEQTIERAMQEKVVLSLEDTTSFSFSGEVHREGLGFLKTGKQGFYAHTALLVSAEQGRPLGVIAVKNYEKETPPNYHKSPEEKKRKKSGAECAMREETEKDSYRWTELGMEVDKRLLGHPGLIHIRDREADTYELLARQVQQGERFVVRANHNRVLNAEDNQGHPTLQSAAASVEAVISRTVHISRRKASSAPKQAKTYPERDAREAQLSFGAMPIVLKGPRYAKASLPEALHLNVVQVWEEHPPDGVEPISWTLLTTEPIDDVDAITKIIDYYRLRWLVEEFFKALKTGCSYEKRQLESKTTLINALAVFIPIAWQLLVLRNICRTEPDAPAQMVLSPTQLQVLKQVSTRPLSASPTVHQALWAIAALGGHLKSNGEPGWMVLGRGFEKLLSYEIGWNAALNAHVRHSATSEIDD